MMLLPIRAVAFGEAMDINIQKKKFIADLISKSKGVLSKMGKPSPIFQGRIEEVSAVVETQLKKRMRNCIIVGPAGVGKTEIAKKAIANTDTEDVFLNLDCSALQAGCIYVGMFEQRFNEIIKPIAEHNAKSKWHVCLFIDEIHVAFQLGKNEFVGTVTFADMLKPYLTEGTITIIGATTEAEYRKYVAKDKALLRRLPPIFVTELGTEQTEAIVADFAGKSLSKDDVKEIVEKSKSIKYLSEPDRSIEVADRLMAKRKANCGKTEGDLDSIVALMANNG